MRRLPIAVLLFAVLAPAAFAAYRSEDAARVIFPRAWEQHRAIAHALAVGRPVYCGGGRGDAVALTFDDGPGPYTDGILDILRAHDAHATFFVVGNRLQYWPELAQREARLGGVGNHTWSHARLTSINPLLVWLELMRTQFTVGEEVGWKPRLFRTPYAAHTPATDRISRELGLVEVFWDVDARDDVPNARVADVVRNVERGLRPGAIVLLHDIHPWTLAALPKVLSAISARGLRAVSVSELLALDPPAKNQLCPYAPVTGD